jgi:hypothetical protein
MTIQNDRQKAALTLRIAVLALIVGCFLTLVIAFRQGADFDVEHGLRVQQTFFFQNHLHPLPIQAGGTLVDDGQEEVVRGRNDPEPSTLPLAGLDCSPWGGPSVDAAQEMVYWQDIPSDQTYKSPFQPTDKIQYMTFEPDGGGWNNIRMR